MVLRTAGSLRVRLPKNAAVSKVRPATPHQPKTRQGPVSLAAVGFANSHSPKPVQPDGLALRVNPLEHGRRATPELNQL